MSHINTLDNPIREVYESATGAFGATTASKSYIGPKGRTGWVKDIEVFLTATAVGTTTVPEVTVGTAAGLVEYGRYRIGTTATAGLANTSTPIRARGLVTGNGLVPTYEDFSGHVKLETGRLPADTLFVISGVAGVGGSPAGTGYHRVTIEWA